MRARRHVALLVALALETLALFPLEDPQVSLASYWFS